MKDKILYRVLVLVFMGILTLPALQMLTRLMPEKKLYGSFYEQKWPAFTFKDWLDFNYQPKFHGFLEQHYGFRPFFIRLYNQLDYSLFKQVNASGVVLGREGFLFEEWFIESHYGRDFAGKEIIDTYASRITRLREKLNSLNTELIVVLAPSKADYWPEYIPERFDGPKGTSNYQAISESLSEAGIPLIDFNRLFIENKNSAHFSLFPKTGTHWSQYGALVALDTLVDFIASTMKRPMPDIELLPVVVSDTLTGSDDDLEKLMNLFFPLRHLETGYPEARFKNAENIDLPDAIVVADSYFWPMFNLPLTGRVFQDVKYWYYNSSIYPDSYVNHITTQDIDFKAELDRADLIILMACPATVGNMGWGFVERGFRELILGMSEEQWQKEYNKMVEEFRQAIMNTPDWVEHIEQKAERLAVPKDTLMIRDARYMVDQMILKGEF